MNRKLYSRLLLASCLAFLIQCSPGGFKAETSPTVSSTDNATKAPTGTTTPDEAAAERRRQLHQIIADTDMTGMINSGLLSNSLIPGVDFDKAKGVYLIRIPMPNFAAGVAFSMNFKDYPGMTLYMDYVSNKPVLTISIPVKYVLRNVTEVAAKMPSGNRIPMFPSGEPPSKGILLTPNRDNKIYLFLSAEAFGLFIETPFDPLPENPYIHLSEFMVPIMNKGGTIPLGYATVVNKVGDFKGGFFVSYRIDPKLGKILDEYYIY